MTHKVATISHHYTNNSSSISDYITLMKPRVMSLVVFTGFSGILLAPTTPHYLINFIAVLCIAMGAGSSAVLNMWYDRDIDSIMQRTKKRPLVVGAIDPQEALSFGIITAFFSVFFMALCVNLFAATLLLFTIFYYVVIYTIWLKRTTMQNIVIGGMAGALPPIIGFAAAANEISGEAIILFMIIFTWTPPHSWALALFRGEDYKNSNIPMMPVVKGEYYTKKQILIYTIIMCITSLVPFYIKMASLTYLIIASILGVFFLYYAISLFWDQNHSRAKRLFLYSIFYLFVIFLALDIFHLNN